LARRDSTGRVEAKRKEKSVAMVASVAGQEQAELDHTFGTVDNETFSIMPIAVMYGFVKSGSLSLGKLRVNRHLTDTPIAQRRPY
jgi:hypothetical protein